VTGAGEETRLAEPDDDAVLDELDRALRAQAEVPPEVLAAAKSIFTWRTVNAELAALSYDSETHGEPAGVRGASRTVRSLSFAAGDSTVELDVTADAMTGLVLPPLPGRVTVEQPGGDGPSVEVDEFGGFSVRPCPSGRFRLRCELGRHCLVTDWIEAS
jgi:hypothetical protein